MSWLSRTWAVCAVPSCEQEILRTRAEDKGWYAKPEGGWLCPVHRPDRVQYDVQARASGERDDE
jgi:hypothetical protein